METALTNTQEYVQEFTEAFSRGFAEIVKAAQVYVSALDDPNVDNEAFRKSCEDGCPGVPKLVWRSIEEVGRGQVHWRMLLDSGSNAAKIRRLPVSVQGEITDGAKYDLLTVDGDTLKVDVRQVGKDWANQIFEKDHIRTIPEQKSWIAKNIVPFQETEAVRLPYRIVGKKVVFSKNTELTKAELMHIILEL